MTVSACFTYLLTYFTYFTYYLTYMQALSWKLYLLAVAFPSVGLLAVSLPLLPRSPHRLQRLEKRGQLRATLLRLLGRLGLVRGSVRVRGRGRGSGKGRGRVRRAWR